MMIPASDWTKFAFFCDILPVSIAGRFHQTRDLGNREQGEREDADQGPMGNGG